MPTEQLEAERSCSKEGGFINLIFLQSASEQEVTEICSSFRSGTAAGYIYIFYLFFFFYGYDSISMNINC